MYNCQECIITKGINDGRTCLVKCQNIALTILEAGGGWAPGQTSTTGLLFVFQGHKEVGFRLDTYNS